MQDFDEDEDDIDERALFDVSGVTFELKQNVRKKTFTLIAIGQEDWNLMRYYLSLAAYLSKMENEFGIMPEPPDEQ